MKYVLLRTDRAAIPGLVAGQVVYTGSYDYGCAHEDTEATGIEHVSLSENPNGIPFFTIPREDMGEYKMTQLPTAASPEANDAIEAMLKTYNWPCNTQNAGRAGWEAARKYLAELQEKAQCDGGVCGTGGYCKGCPK